MSGGLRPTARLAAWTAGLLVTGRLLYGVGSDDLRPPLTSFTDLRMWLADTPPPMMAMAVVRLAALAAVAYLLAATALAVAAGLIRARPLEAAARRLTPAVVRRVAAGGGGVGLALGAALGTVPSPDLTPHPVIATGAMGSADVATMTRHDPHVATMTRTADPPAPGAPDTEIGVPGLAAASESSGGIRQPAAVSGAADPTDAVRGLRTAGASRAAGAAHAREPSPPSAREDGGPPTTAELPPLTATMVRTDGSPAPGAGSGVSPLPQPGNTWVVGPGDSFWSIAEDMLSPSGGDPPSERDVGRYWRRLIAANRAGLVDPGNPDLLIPGQELDLPPP